MPRIRSIKPSIWGDDRFASLSRDARLLAIGLISAADDAGRFIASSTAIAGAVFPHDDIPSATVRRWRDEVARAGLIAIYQVGGRDYGWFPNWKKHQVINRPSKSVLPAPPGYGGDPGPSEPPPDQGDLSEQFTEPSVNGHGATHGATHGGLTTRKGVGEGSKNPPNPPSPRGGRRCTKHRRPKDYCDDCHLPPLAPVPPWCGQCESDEHRWIELPDGRAAHCPRCHPSTVRAVTA